MTFTGHESAFRGEDVIKNRQNASVCVLGAGALGSWLCDLLCRQGYTNVTVVDMEKVDNDNFGTQNYGKSNAGRSKSEQTKSNIFLRLGVAIKSEHKKVTDSNVRKILKGHDLVVDLFDNAESRELVRKFCQEQNKPCVHAGMGTMGYFEVIWNERYKVAYGHEEDPNAPCDYPLAANLVIICVGVIAEVINSFVDEQKTYDVDFWLSKMTMNKYEYCDGS